MPTRMITAILLALLISIPAFAQKYVVKIERNAKVGEKYSHSASGSRSKTTTAVRDQQVVESETVDYQVQFAAIAEVLEVDEKGQEVKIALTVEKFTKIEGSSLTELVPPGKVIIADGNRENPYSLQNGSLSKQAQEALGVVIAVAEPGGLSDDEVFGTTEPKQVGESWALNNTLVAEVMQIEGVSGVAKIAGLEEIGGVEYLDIRIEVGAEQWSPTAVPEGAAIDKAIIRFSAQGYFPVDHSIPIYAESTTMNLQFVLKGMPGTEQEGLVTQVEMQQTNQILQTAGLDGQLLQEALNDKHKEIIELLKQAGAKE